MKIRQLLEFDPVLAVEYGLREAVVISGCDMAIADCRRCENYVDDDGLTQWHDPNDPEGLSWCRISINAIVARLGSSVNYQAIAMDLSRLCAIQVYDRAYLNPPGFGYTKASASYWYREGAKHWSR